MGRNGAASELGGEWRWDHWAGGVMVVLGLSIQGIYLVMLMANSKGILWMKPAAGFLERWLIRQSFGTFVVVVMGVGLLGHAAGMWVGGWRATGPVSWWARVGWWLLVGLPLSISILTLIHRVREALGKEPESLFLEVWVSVQVLCLALVCCSGSQGRRMMVWVLWFLALISAPVLLSEVVWLAGMVRSEPEAWSIWWYRRGLFLFPTGALAVTVGALWVFRGRYERLRERELGGVACRGCGYDLTGTAAAGLEVCPECGRGVQGLKVGAQRQ
jgi:hypothetical protein